MLALRHLRHGTAVLYTETTGARYAADIVHINTSLKAWGIVTVKVCRHIDRRLVWIPQRHIIKRCS